MKDDVISRQAAVDLWEKYRPTIAVDAMQYDAELRRLPSAQPETKLIAEIKMSKEDVQSAFDETVARIKAESERKKGKRNESKRLREMQILPKRMLWGNLSFDGCVER